jgi:hypothetical protein
VRGGGGVFFDTAQQLGGYGFDNPQFSNQNFNGPSSFPGNPASFAIPPANPPAPTFSVFGLEPHLQLPYTLEWNASMEQALGRAQSLSVSYIGSRASRLLQTTLFSSATNPILLPGGTFFFAHNGLSSDYGALQAQFRRRLSAGLTSLASYTWSHCIDFGSSNFELGYVRSNCGFDVRHNFEGALSYDLPNVSHGALADAFLHNWGFDGRFGARTGFPVDLRGNAFVDPRTGQLLSSGVNFVSGKPLYISGAQCNSVYAVDFGNKLPCPGGRAFNPDAFTAASSGLGNVPRNFMRGFGAWQMNVAIRREFPIYENLKLQFRAEGFNIFNHPNFGYINPFVGQNTFGQATFTLANSLARESALYQMGGPRSMQFALKLIF